MIDFSYARISNKKRVYILSPLALFNKEHNNSLWIFINKMDIWSMEKEKKQMNRLC